MPLFYVPELNTEEIILPEEESHHIFRVLRLKAGDAIELTDGKGLMGTARITREDKKAVRVKIEHKNTVAKERPYTLHIGIAPTKNTDRFEWFVEKATEIGVDEITPLVTHNSERDRIRNDRMEKVIISAMKQSLKAYKPKLNKICTLGEFFKKNYTDYQLFIAYCGDEQVKLLREEYEKGRNTVILIGPEGDFTSEEVKQAMEKGFSPVSFGKTRLRTETAGLVACHSVYILNQ